jgi:hypothetical protein
MWRLRLIATSIMANGGIHSIDNSIAPRRLMELKLHQANRFYPYARRAQGSFA